MIKVSQNDTFPSVGFRVDPNGKCHSRVSCEQGAEFMTCKRSIWLPSFMLLAGALPLRAGDLKNPGFEEVGDWQIVKKGAGLQAAFDDVIKAREDEERVKNEAQAYANDLLPRARGAAARQLEEANAYKESIIAQAEGEASRFLQLLTEYRQAPEVTRKRLYLETVESVLARANKVMVDVKSGNSLMYLPLDQIIKQDRTQGSQQLAPMGGGAEPTSLPTVTEKREVIRERRTR